MLFFFNAFNISFRTKRAVPTSSKSQTFVQRDARNWTHLDNHFPGCWSFSGTPRTCKCWEKWGVLSPGQCTSLCCFCSSYWSSCCVCVCVCVCMCLCVCSQSISCVLLFVATNPMDCSLPGSSVHGIFQTRILEYLTVLVKQFFGFFGRATNVPASCPHSDLQNPWICYFTWKKELCKYN